MSERSTSTTRSTPRSISVGRIVALIVLVSHAIGVPSVQAAERYRKVSVQDPYLEMHSGPARGYPKFYVVDRGESVEIIKRRTDWFLVRTENGREGWVDRRQMERTLQPTGDPLDFSAADQDDFTNSRWEGGVMAGDFGGANIISVYGAYSLNPHVGVEMWGSQILGNFSNGWMGSLNIIHETWPDWRVSPFFTLGAGVVHTAPKSTIVQAEDRTDQVGHAGAGLRFYAARRFILRAEYKSYVVFTSRDDNEEVEEWKVGFAFFF
jgi:hypothetical protein